MFRRAVVNLTFLLATLSCCCADEDIFNFTDANLSPMALASSPIIVNSSPICPSDSELVDGMCKCNRELCELPPCDRHLNFVHVGIDTPGNCCDVYSCDNCTKETLVNGNGTCVCADNATLNEKGDCECIDHHKSLINGTCVCDINKCELPLLCDNHSVPIREKDGCCYKTKCKPCPEDTFAPDSRSGETESICVCHYCPEAKCDDTHVLQILLRGRNVPGNCCDIYQCVPKDSFNTLCIVNDTSYTNGEWWIINNQNCTCSNGISVCLEPKTTEGLAQTCLHNNVAYPYNATWAEDTCTNCTCDNGNIRCVAHMCNITVSEVRKYNDCFDGNNSYSHKATWMKDSCTKCTCENGFLNCSDTLCNKIYDDCPSFENCKKYCKNGFKINKRGCKICRCRFPEFIPEKYPLLDGYLRDHNLTETEAMGLLHGASTKKEDITPTIDPIEDKVVQLIVTPVITFLAGVVLCFALMKYCKKKWAYQYSPVSKPMDNNNLPPQGDIKYICEKSPLKT